MKNRPLTQLINQAKTGDQSAQNELVQRFQAMAIGYAYAVLADFHLAQDSAQEAFIEAFACLAHLRQPTAFPTWLRRIVFKHCDRILRKRHRQDGEWLPTSSENPAEALEADRTRQAIERAIRILPARERTVVSLFYISGCAQKEIAAFLDLPLSSIKYRLHAARKRLKTHLSAALYQPLPNGIPPSNPDFSRALFKRRRTMMSQICPCPLCGAQVEYELGNEQSDMPIRPEDPPAYHIYCHDVCREYVIIGRQEAVLNPLPPERRLILSEYTRALQENNCITTLYESRIQYILESHDFACAAAQHYGLETHHVSYYGEQSGCEFSQVLTGGRRYIVRVMIYDEAPQAILRSQIFWLRSLRQDAGLSVPNPIQAPDGGYFQQLSLPQWPEPRYCILFDAAPGTPLDRIDAEQRTAGLYKKIGAFIARTHKHAESFTPPDWFSVPNHTHHNRAAVEQYRQEQYGNDTTAVGYRTLGELAKLMGDLGQTNDVYGMPHLANDDVLVVSEDGIGISSLNHWHRGYYLADLARALDFYWLTGTADTEAFLAGYQTIRPLNEQALEQLALFKRARKYLPRL